MKNFLRHYDKQLILAFLLFCTIVYSFIAITSHNHFLTFGWDLGFFDQLIWKVSNFIYPVSSLNKVSLLANHFSPILFFFTPLYWIWSDPRMLLIEQAFVVVFAAWPLYLLSINKTQNRLFSFAIIFSYLFFLGTQWSILNEFHELTVVPLFVVLTFYALEKNKKILFWIGIFGLTVTKEEILFLVAAIGLTIAFYFRKKKLGFALTIASLIFFFFLVLIFMPFISEKGIYQHSHLSTNARTPLEFMEKVLVDPLFALNSLVTPPQKIQTFIISFLSFGLIPFFAPLTLLLPLFEQFLMRFLYTGPQFTTWQNVNHHAAPTAILLPIACIYAAYSLTRRFKVGKKRILLVISMILFASTILQDILLKAPIHSLAKKQFYETLPWMEDNYTMIREVKALSQDGPIAVQNSLYPHLSQRKDIYLLPEINEAEYILIDLHNGPNKYAPFQHNQMVEFIGKLITENKFIIYKKQGEAMILARRK